MSHQSHWIAILTALASPLLVLATGNCREAMAPPPPNVLFIAVDDLNDWTGAMEGHPMAHTPNLDKLMERGILFSNAHCSAPVCAASRNSLLSGLQPSTTGWYANDPNIERTHSEVLKDTVPLPQHFRDNGYRTLAAGKIYHTGVADFAEDQLWDEVKPPVVIGEPWKSRGDGYDTDMFYPFPAQGSQITKHFGPGTKGQSLCWDALEDADIPDGRMPDESVADWAIRQLQSEQGKPFLLAVGFFRPHVPFVVPKKYFEPYDLDKIQIPDVPADELSDVPLLGRAMTMGLFPAGDHTAVLALGEQFWRELIRAYLASVTFADAQIGRVLDALDKSPHAANTIIVLWSDHGQNLGEKFNWRKMCLWETSTRVPLVFAVPGDGYPSVRNMEPVSLLDIYPTLIELCGLPAIDSLEGESLLPMLRDPERSRSRPPLTTWLYGNHSVRSKQWRYTRYRDGSEELYDHLHDPGEQHNLAADPGYREIIEEHKAFLPTANALPPGDMVRRPDAVDRALEFFSKNGLPDWV